MQALSLKALIDDRVAKGLSSFAMELTCRGVCWDGYCWECSCWVYCCRSDVGQAAVMSYRDERYSGKIVARIEDLTHISWQHQ